MSRPYVVKTRAFTLVELIVVVAIIAMLALVALPNFEEAQTRAKGSAVKNNLRITSTKLDIFRMDTDEYPLSVKWRRLIFWRMFPGEEGDSETSFSQRVQSLYGPHWDIFEWESLKQNALQDYAWVCNKERQHLFNGFSFFSPPMVLAAQTRCTPQDIIYRTQWEDSSPCHWQELVRKAGDWILMSPGPDLVMETPAWWERPFPCWRPEYRIEFPPEGYTEKGLFTAYDPTNGSVSYGNIFRTQRNPAGLEIDAEFIRGMEDKDGTTCMENVNLVPGTSEPK